MYIYRYIDIYIFYNIHNELSRFKRKGDGGSFLEDKGCETQCPAASLISVTDSLPSMLYFICVSPSARPVSRSLPNSLKRWRSSLRPFDAKGDRERDSRL